MAVQYDITTGTVTTGFTAATARTMLEGTADSGLPVEWIEMSVGNMTATGYTIIDLCTYSASGTGTSYTPKKHGQTVGTAKSTWEINSTVEPSGATVVWSEVYANPFTLRIQYPLGREFFHAVSIVQGLRITSSVAPDSTHPVICSLTIEE